MLTCPRCGKGKLFSGWVSVADQCGVCGLDLKAHEQGDGPAFFGIVIVGTVIAVAAAVVEIKFAPAFWVHAALWIPLIIVGSLASLRYGKALLIAMQYRVRGGDFGAENFD